MMLEQAARVVDYLETRGVACAVIGGVALGAHGLARATLDVDLLVSSTRVLEPGFWDDLTTLPPPEVCCGDADDPLLGVVRFAGLEPAVDVIVGRSPLAAEVIARRVFIAVACGRLPFADVADLIILKLAASGPQDLLDVRLLIAADPGVCATVEQRLAGVPDSVRRAWAAVLTE